MTVFKRARWITLGYVAGIGTSYALARRVKRTLAQYTPPEVAKRGSERVRQALADGRSAMREREAQLQRDYADRPRLFAVEGGAQHQTSTG